MLPIVLIHGFPLDGAMWHHQADFLRARGYEVLTPDLAGFGNPPTSVPPEKTSATMEGYAREVREIILRLPGQRAVVGGFSMGGYVMLALLRESPELVAGAMFIDTRAETDTPEGRATRLKSIEHMQTHGTGNLLDSLCQRLFRKTSPLPAVIEETRQIMRRQPVDAVIAAQWAMAHRRDQTDLLPSLQMPALIVVGEEDMITPPASAEAMAARLANHKLVRIPNAGHMAPVEQPEMVNRAIGDFAAHV